MNQSSSLFWLLEETFRALMRIHEDTGISLDNMIKVTELTDDLVKLASHCLLLLRLFQMEPSTKTLKPSKNEHTKKKAPKILVQMTKKAKNDILQTTIDFERKTPGQGHNFLDSIDASIEKICKRPTSYKKMLNDVRYCPIKEFPFALWFRAEEKRSKARNNKKTYIIIAGLPLKKSAA